MLKETSQVLDRNTKLVQEDLRDAASHLLAKQFLYRTDGHNRAHYLILSEYRAYYEKLFDAVGYRMTVDDDYECIGVIPTVAFRELKKVDTLMLLVLRQVYQEEMVNMQSIDGVVAVTFEALLLRYEALTKMPRPEKKTQFLESLDTIKRFNIVKLNNQTNTMEEPLVKILPAILLLINKDTIAQIDDFNKAKQGSVPVVQAGDSGDIA